MPKIPGYLPVRDILAKFDIDRTTLMGMRRRGEVKSFSLDRKSVVEGKSVFLGGRRII